MKDAFDELFLTEEEEKLYQLKKLENQFILSQEEMLKELGHKAVTKIEEAKQAIKSYKEYKMGGVKHNERKTP